MAMPQGACSAGKVCRSATNSTIRGRHWCGLLWKESVGADGDAAPLMMKNLPANCRRRRQKISGQLFNLMLDAILPDPFKKIIRPGLTGRLPSVSYRDIPYPNKSLSSV
ncbi:MAG TPA: hypothetical protein VK815_14865 [Candidatus Acidoferrales bacterium]|nr:hypothetical protein [Candidatus Acidoferrales bacterium]